MPERPLDRFRNTDANEREGLMTVARDVVPFICETAFVDGHPVDGHVLIARARTRYLGDVALAEDPMHFAQS